MLKTFIPIKNLMKTYFLFIFLIVLLFTCTNKEQLNQKKVIAAIFYGDTIYLDQVDEHIKYQLHDILYEAYLARYNATIAIIENDILDSLASSQGMSENEYILSRQNGDLKFYCEELRKKMTSAPINDFRNYGRTIDPETPEGINYINENIYKETKRKLLEGFKISSMSNIFIKPPTPPDIKLSDLGHDLSNIKENPQLTVCIISNLDCQSCRAHFSHIQKWMKKFQDKPVNFKMIVYSDDISISCLASEAANNQGKYKEMVEAIMTGEYNAYDTTFFINFARKINLNEAEFIRDLRDNNIKIKMENDFSFLNKKGIYTTPTVVVNSYVFPDAFDTLKIENNISELLK